MNNLVVITQKVDEGDDLLGFFVDWLREFARHFSRVDVITLAKGEAELPANIRVWSLGKERGRAKVFWPFIFYWRLLRGLPGSRGVFAHMSPAFAVAAWPATALFGKRLVLWYLHRSVTPRLRLAIRLADAVATASKKSLNIRSDKIAETGHGINVSRFEGPRGKVIHEPIRIISVGRISPIKDQETLIEALSLLKKRDVAFRAEIIGRAVMPRDYEYERRLRRFADDKEMNNMVRFVGMVPYRDIAERYRPADISVNLTPTGGIDKAVLESITAGCIPLVSNTAFKEMFGVHAAKLIFRHSDAEDLAEKILGLMRLSSNEMESIRQDLKNKVTSGHGLFKTIAAIASLFK